MGWTGDICDDNIDECSLSSPCQHNGTCSDCEANLSDCPFGYDCTCTEGFFGDNCETNVSYCVSSPCQNEGICVDVIEGPGYTCNCPTSYTGQDCEVEVGVCEDSPCLNGGICTVSNAVAVALVG